MDRKQFIKSGLFIGAGLSLPVSCLELSDNPEEVLWDQGELLHLLPTVNHERILFTASFRRSLKNPFVRIGTRKFVGEMRDSQGEFWIFDCQGLEANTTYDLRIYEEEDPLCDPWPLKTFPAPETDVEKLRVLIFTCAGGHPEIQKVLPIPPDEKESSEHFKEKRKKLLARGLSFIPDAMVAVGDSVYWDLSGNGKGRIGTDTNELAFQLAGKFDHDKPILGTENERVLKKAVNPQIAELYGTACRSTPVFFLNDDHDYFENDEANDVLVTFPPKRFQLELARTVQGMYYPAFLPDPNRPIDLPGSNAEDTIPGASEGFGTLRFGKLAELLLYDCRRFVNLEGEKALFIPETTEKWLLDRTASKDVLHSIHIPSTPFGWSAGKWLEWYPDILGPDKQLHADLPKFLWQKGWQKQHDRILQAMYEAKHKKAITISGDLHTFAGGRIFRNGEQDFSKNPIHSYVAGTLGATVWPSTFRKVKASVPNDIGMEEYFENREENGFSIVDIQTDRVSVRMFNYLWSRDALSAIPSLRPFQNLNI